MFAWRLRVDLAAVASRPGRPGLRGKPVARAGRRRGGIGRAPAGRRAQGSGVCLALDVATDPLGRRGLAIGWAVGVATVAATELAARILVRAPHAASTPAVLAVRDELMSDLVTVVLMGAVGPSLLCIFVAGRILPEAGLATAALVLLPLLLMETQRRRRVRERLWAAGHRPGPSNDGPGSVGGPLVPEPAP